MVQNSWSSAPNCDSSSQLITSRYKSTMQGSIIVVFGVSESPKKCDLDTIWMVQNGAKLTE